MNRILFAAVLFILLFAGLFPSGFSQFRPVERVEGPDPGLRFFGKSLVYTEEFPESTGNRDVLTISLEMTPFPQIKPKFGAILTIFDKVDRTQITIGQWNDSLMVLAGDDFSNRRHEPKIYASLPFEGKMNLDIVSSDSGTRVFINGKSAGSQSALFLKLPENPDQSHLILGSGVSTECSWEGIIHSVKIFDSVLSPDLPTTETTPLVSYRLDTGGNAVIPDETAHGPDLRIARQWIQLDSRFLHVPELHSLYKGVMPKDIVLNFFGFMPFGFMLYKMLGKRVLRRKITGIAIVLAASFLLSMMIESLQTLMPARDSSLLDLTLNTLGGASGGLLVGSRKALQRTN